MPIYEFECNECKKVFEEVVLRTDEVVECPDCKSQQTSKLVSKCSFASNLGGQSVGAMPQASNSSRSCSGCSGGSCSTCG